MPTTRAAALAMSEEMEETTTPRASRFKEHTNTSNSIRPPPDELWKDLGIEQLIEQFNEENAAPPFSRKSSANRVPSAARPALERNASSISNGFGTTTSVAGPRSSTSTQPATPAPHEGTYARFQRAVASVFGSVLGKRKAAAMEADREKAQQQHLLDERKKAAEVAYHEAKDRGLLPTPKVFIRPSMRAASQNFGTPAPPLDKLRLTAAVAGAATPNRTPRTPRTPGTLHHTPSKKDLHKQKKLSKRVSNLEQKLASARKDLQTVLHPDLPPVPLRLSLERANQQPTPEMTQSENEVDATTPIPEPPCSIGKIIKKRKATTQDEDVEYKPLPTDSDGDIDLLSDHASERENEMPTPERMIKRVKSSASRKNLKKQSSRLQKRLSRGSLRERNGSQEREVRVVPDGDKVPDVPVIPREMESLGRRVRVTGDDGFGGLGHEIF
jgi:hypothetical protein